MKAHPESVLEPAVRTLIRNLLCKPSSTQQMYRVADSQLHDEECQNAFNTSSTGDQDELNSSSKSTFDAGTGQGVRDVKPCHPFTSDGDETWLVPVRTARTVLAVLKITVRSPTKKIVDDKLSLPRNSSALQENSPGFMSGRDSDRVDFFCSDEVEGNDRNAAARDALITFSNLLAPLLTAARQIEMVIKVKKEQEIKVKKEQESVSHEVHP